MDSSLRAKLRSALKMSRDLLAAVQWPDQDTGSTFLAMGASSVENSCKAFWHSWHACIAALWCCETLWEGQSDLSMAAMVCRSTWVRAGSK